MSLSIALTLAIAGALAAEDPSVLAAEAIATNPGIAAMEAGIYELEHLAGVADVWPDPVAAVELSNLPVTSWDLGGHPMAGLQLKVQQTIPYPGVTSLRRELSEARIEEARARLAEGELRLGRAVEESWWQLTLVRQLRGCDPGAPRPHRSARGRSARPLRDRLHGSTCLAAARAARG